MLFNIITPDLITVIIVTADFIERKVIESEIFNIPVISIKLINTSAPYYILNITAGKSSKPVIAIIIIFNIISIADLNTDRNIYIAEKSALINCGYYSILHIGDNGYYRLFFISCAYKDKNKYFNYNKTGY